MPKHTAPAHSKKSVAHSKEAVSDSPSGSASSSSTEEGLNLDPAAAAVRIIQRQQAAKLSPRATGYITYEIGVDPRALPQGDLSKAKNWTLPEVFIRITGNDSSGYFSDEWVSFTRIQACLAELPPVPFKAKVFQGLFERRGANNHGFLGAALKQEKLLIADTDKPLVLTAAASKDWQGWLDQLKNQLIQTEPLEDRVALRYARKAQQLKERQEKLAALQAEKLKEKAAALDATASQSSTSSKTATPS